MTSTSDPVKESSAGAVAPGFESVRELFDSLLREDPHYSAQVCAYHEGEKVVDLTGGPDMDASSVTGVFSCSKGAAALCIALLVQEGSLDLDRAVAAYWPEFGEAGKSDVTVRQLLSHQVGLVGIEGFFTADEYNDSERVAARLAAAWPAWKPGTAFSYHALVIGAFMEELVRRIKDTTLQQYYDRCIRAPYGIDFFLGLPPAMEPRFRDKMSPADVPVPSAPRNLREEIAAWADPNSLGSLQSNGADASRLLELPNVRENRAAGMSSAAGVAGADGISRLYAAALTGVGGESALLEQETIRNVSLQQVWGLDRIWGTPGAFATVFQVPRPDHEFGSYRAFGHDGAGGSLGFADPCYSLGFGYVPQRMEPNFDRANVLSKAVRRAVSVRV